PVFFSHCSLPTPIPPSFPTRRSSDLGPSRLRVYSEYFRNILFTIALLYHTHNQMSSDSYLFCFDSFQHLIRCRVFDTIRYGNVSRRIEGACRKPIKQYRQNGGAISSWRI